MRQPRRVARLHDLQQIGHRLRQRPEAVDHFGGKGLQIGFFAQIGRAAIERHAERQIGHIVFRNQNRRIHRNRRAGRILRRPQPARLGLSRQNRIFQHRLIQFKPDFADMPGLLVPQQIAGAALIQIVAGEFKAGAQRIEACEHMQPLFRRHRDAALWRGGQQRIGAPLGTPHPPAQLIQLRQSEHVRAVHDQRVGIRDIQPRFDDGGGQQHVEALLIKGRHPVLDLAWCHLAMRRDRSDFRHGVAQIILHISDVGNARHHDEALPAAEMLAQQRLAHHHRIERRNRGANGQPVHRRRGDHRKLAQSRQRHLQGARDRRRGQRQHMHIMPQRLQPFLVRYAKALLFVDNHQAQPLEIDGFREDGMRPHHHIHGTVRQPFARRLCLARRNQARKRAHLQREAMKARLEGFRMLPRQQRCRAHHRHLRAARCRHKSCPERHFGLAEADIAAHQPIHRPPGRQILDHIGHRAQLIVGLGPWEAVHKGGIALRIGRKSIGLARGAQGSNLQQFVRNLADALLHPRLALRPGLSAQPVKPHAFGVRAIAAQNIEIFNRHIKLVTAGIFQSHGIVRGPRNGDRGEPQIAPDAMLLVHHQFAQIECLQILQEGIRLLRRAPPHQPVAQHVLLGPKPQLAQPEAAFQRQHHHRNRAFRAAGQCLLPALGRLQLVRPGLAQQPDQPIARPRRIACQHHPTPGFQRRSQPCRNR